MSGSIQMPKYKCHKEVWALKIEQVKADNIGRTFLHFADERYAPIEIANGWLMKHMPVPGGYYVQYQDGYASYSPAEAFESGYALIENTEVPDPSKNELSVAFRLAAQIAGIKDEVADFMAGLDGALLAGKSIEALHDEIMERIALYDTPEAVDLFMNLVKTREAGLPDGLTPEAIELLKGLPFPHRRIAMVFDAPNLGDGYMVPEVVQAFNESHRRSDWGKYPFTASNDITINVINLSAGGSPGEISVEPPLQHANKTNQQGQIELLTAALDAARHELDGVYLSANAMVLDAYQLPVFGDASMFTELMEWCGNIGINGISQHHDGVTVHLPSGPLKAGYGDYIVKYRNTEPGRMTFNVFEPEVFATLYTSAAELLK